MADSILTDAEADDLFERVLSCEPAITPNVIGQIERMVQSRNFGITRRAGLTLASKGGDFYKQISEDRETAVTMAIVAKAAQNQAESLRQLAELLERGATRTMVALCAHEDMPSILNEAEAGLTTKDD